MKRGRVALLALALAAAGLAVPQAAQATSGCRVTWGSLDRTVAGGSGPLDPTLVTNVRAGRHACYDRLVFDMHAGTPATSVRYVPAVTGDASGDPVPLRGGAFLHIVLRGVATPPDAGVPGYRPADRRELVDVRGWRTLRQVASAEGFEGYDTYGVGVRARLPFRVFTLPGPGCGSRVVVDVAHTW